MKKMYSIMAAVLYIITFFILLPYYQYQIDSDGISYIKVAERLADNNFADALNGYWSPLSSWLLVPFIKLGFDPVFAAKYINGLLGLLCIYSIGSFIDRFPVHLFFKKLSSFCIAILCLSFCFNELCADLLSLFILSLYFNIVINKKGINSKPALLIIGALGGLAYFAKAYNFFFFLVHITLTLSLYSKKETGHYFSLMFIKKWGIIFLIFFIITTPYIYSISKKYHHLTINTAGSLNTSWQIAPGITDSFRVVIPPPYYNAVSSWDDPVCIQRKRITPFTSGKYFLKQLKVTAHNAIVLVKILTAASVSWIVCIPMFFFFLLKRKKEKKKLNPRLFLADTYSSNEKEETELINWLLLLSTALYPAGYLLIVIEWRYIWVLSVFILLMNAILLSDFYRKGTIGKSLFRILSIAVLLSFCVNPVQELISKVNENKYEHEVAAAFNKAGITGNFLSIIDNGNHQASLNTICYLTQSKLMGAYKTDIGLADLLQASRQYSIQYFIWFYETGTEKQQLLNTEFTKAAIKIYDNLYPGVLVYKLY